MRYIILDNKLCKDCTFFSCTNSAILILHDNFEYVKQYSLYFLYIYF